MQEHNPYAAPESSLTRQADASVPGLGAAPLFRASGIGVAAVFGTVLAGALLMALNERALGRTHQVWPTLGLGLLAMGVVMVLAWVLPEQIPSVVFTVLQLAAIQVAVARAQGDAIKARVAAGLPMRSNWAAFGIALLVLLAILAVAALALSIYLWSAGLTWGELVRGAG